MSFHADIVPTANLSVGPHVVHYYEFTNTTTMNAGTDTTKGAVTFAASDIGRIARVGSSAPYTFYILANATGPAWTQIDGGGGGGGGTVFADDVFRVQDNGDATKEIAFQASGITTATTRTITMPDADVDLGDISVPKLAFWASGRWSAVTGLYRGPSYTYGPVYHEWNQSFGATPAPNYQAQGYVFPVDVTLARVHISFRPSAAALTFTANLIKHETTDDSSSVTNTLVGTDLVLSSLSNTRRHNRDFDLSLAADFDAGDMLIPSLTCTDATTKYLYFSMTIEAELR